MHFRYLLLALAMLAMAEAARKRIWGTPQERSTIMEEAMSEAKLSAQLQEETQKAKAAVAKTKPVTAQTLLNKGFKKPSKMAIKQGKARLMMEDMVHRAERKLEELRRKQTAAAASDEEKARMLADELYHTPGTLLSEDEIAKMYIESECEDERVLKTKCEFIPNVNVFRTIDGTCNNFEKPLQGASDTEFRRLTPPDYEDGVSQLRGFIQAQDPETAFGTVDPSARLISRRIISDVVQDEIPFTHLLMQFGQFLDHDLDLGPEFEVECEGCEFTEQCEPIRVELDDPAFGVLTREEGVELEEICLPLRRSIPVCRTEKPGSFGPREQINVLTSYIDGSMIYGSNEEQGDAVRLFQDGLLKVGPVIGDGRDSLPVDDENPEEGIVACPGRDPRDCFLCGDVRCNEQVSLTIMHTLWVREHNRIAKELKTLNPFWSDERLYEEARKIVGAVIQKIVYYDYLPKILGVKIFNDIIGPFIKYDPEVDASVPNAFATAAYRYGHSLVRPQFPRLDPNYNNALPPLGLENMFFNPPQYAASGGTSPIARGWVNVNSRRMDEFMNIVLTTQLFQTNAGPPLDLASLNLQRARDHGLARYRTWRNFCARPDVFPNLGPAEFEDFMTEERLRELHGEPDLGELWISGLAEQRLEDSLLGPTFACIFALTFRNVRDGDRFYFEKPGVFTTRQLAEIKKATFSQVICDNTDTTTIQPDAFLSNQTNQRVSCTGPAIPRIDLTEWQEDGCFILIEAPTNQLIAARSRQGRRVNEVFTNVGSCLPIVCPTSTTRTTVTTFPAPVRRRCEFRAASNFATILNNNVNTHRIRLSAGDPNILTFEECQNPSSRTEPSLTFSCITQAAAASTSPCDNPENPCYSGELPDEVIADIIDEYKSDPANNVQASAASKTMSDDNKAEAIDNAAVQEKDLLLELKEAMKKLN